MTRPTKPGPTRPLFSAGSLDGSGGTLVGPVASGLVPTSTGSNSWLWLENVRRISVNGTTNVQGPFVNFANGSNTTVTVDMVGAAASNTIRVHATGGGSVSFGSNATRVSEVSFVGAGSDSARTDHIHDGIGTITASSSNTMQRGTWNVRPGAGIALTLTDTDGDGEFDTTTIVNTGQGGGSGSSGLVLLEQHTASSSATLDFTTFITSAYDDYLIELVHVIPATNATGFFMRVGTGAGPTYDTGSNYEGGGARWAEAGHAFDLNVGGTSISLDANGTVSNSGSGGGISGSVHLYNRNPGTIQVHGYAVTTVWDGSTVVQSNLGWEYKQTTAVTALRFLFGSGNIASGIIRAYGLAK